MFVFFFKQSKLLEAELKLNEEMLFSHRPHFSSTNRFTWESALQLTRNKDTSISFHSQLYFWMEERTENSYGKHVISYSGLWHCQGFLLVSCLSEGSIHPALSFFPSVTKGKCSPIVMGVSSPCLPPTSNTSSTHYLISTGLNILLPTRDPPYQPLTVHVAPISNTKLN